MKLSFVSSINVSGKFDLEASENKLAPSHVTVLLWNYPSTGATLKISKENGLDKDECIWSSNQQSCLNNTKRRWEINGIIIDFW